MTSSVPKRIIATSLGATLAVLLGGCPKKPTPQTTHVIIGMAIDLTSTQATPSWQAAAQQALTDVNQGLAQVKNSPFANLEFDLSTLDTARNTQTAANDTQTLAEQGAKAVILGSSSEALQANALNYAASVADAGSDAGSPATNLDLPLLCGACSSDKINNPKATDANPLLQAAEIDSGHWMVRTVMSNVYEAKVFVGLLTAKGNNGDIDNDGQFKISVLANSDLKSFPSTITKVAPTGAKVDPVYFDPTHDVNDATYWATAMQNAAGNTNTSVTPPVVDGYPDALTVQAPPGIIAALLKAYAALPSSEQEPWMHVDNFRSPVVLQELGAQANGMEGVSYPFVDASASGSAFAQELQATTGQAPQLYDAMFYDAATIAALAILAAAESQHADNPTLLTGDEIRSALFQVSDTSAGTAVGAGPSGVADAVNAISSGKTINYGGASGPCTIDTNGNVLDRIVHWVVQNQQFVEVGTYDCVANPTTCPKQ